MTDEEEKAFAADAEAKSRQADADRADERDPAECYNCGCYGSLVEFAGEELYVCPQCGDEWSAHPEPPEL